MSGNNGRYGFSNSETLAQCGEKIIGYFQVCFPEEIAHAAGILPLKMRGATIEPTHADSHFSSYLHPTSKLCLNLRRIRFSLNKLLRFGNLKMMFCKWIGEIYG
jgi:benzoyl-CoA reductase/2-hydroxyglutaryl-CoA dehydratase subunit BcrC/BadD/HgdB